MKNLVKDKRAQGFTIIEVMIVLAIAGLIMAIVFFAVPQLQRNARDNQRQSVANRVKAELDTYSGNNQGAYPFTYSSGTTAVPAAWTAAANCPISTGGGVKSCQDFANRYLANVNINDPATNAAMPIFISKQTSAPGAPGWVKGQLYIAVGAKCSGDQIVASAGNSTYAVVVGLDRTNTDYCVDNG